VDPFCRKTPGNRMIAPSKLKKIVLLLASSTIFLVAALYGVSPYRFASAVLGISEPYHNLAHILRAMMCMYFGFGFYWFFAAFSAKYRNPALLTVMLFPAGLVTGRIISLFADGKPRPFCFFTWSLNLFRCPLPIGHSGCRSSCGRAFRRVGA
jgi:Domain of unknown function (DUF4345)